MGQEFIVLRCFSCQTFQVHQVKKIKKWNCKMCGEKQSLVKVYGRGSGADCRRHVQKLNSLRGEILQAQAQLASSPWKQEADDDEEEEEEVEEIEASGGQLVEEVKASRWSKYLDKKDEETAEEELQEEENVCNERDGRHAHRNTDNRNARVENRGWSSVSRKHSYSHHTGAHCPPKRTKQQKLLQKEGEGDLYPSRGLSRKALMNNKDIFVTNDARSPSSVAGCLSTERGAAVMELSAVGWPCFTAEESIPPKSGGSVLKEKTSKWARFMALPSDTDDGTQKCCWSEDSRQTQVESVFRVASAAYREPSCTQRFDVPRLGHKTESPFHEGAPSVRTPHPSLRSLFQTEEDFDDAL